MPNKDWKKLNELDQTIRRHADGGMGQGTMLKIEFVWGFELFNTRPYHNYETWSGGYQITDERNNIKVRSEDLDDAITLWASAVKRVKAGEPLLPYRRLVIAKPSKPSKTPTEAVSDRPVDVPDKS